MHAADLISRYEQILLLTTQMHAAAEQGAWDQLVELELSRNGLFDLVKPMDAAVELNPPELRRRSELIESILSHDSATHVRVQAHLNQMQLEFASDQNTQRLRQAYGV